MASISGSSSGARGVVALDDRRRGGERDPACRASRTRRDGHLVDGPRAQHVAEVHHGRHAPRVRVVAVHEHVVVVGVVVDDARAQGGREARQFGLRPGEQALDQVAPGRVVDKRRYSRIQPAAARIPLRDRARPRGARIRSSAASIVPSSEPRLRSSSGVCGRTPASTRPGTHVSKRTRCGVAARPGTDTTAGPSTRVPHSRKPEVRRHGGQVHERRVLQVDDARVLRRRSRSSARAVRRRPSSAGSSGRARSAAAPPRRRGRRGAAPPARRRRR